MAKKKKNGRNKLPPAGKIEFLTFEDVCDIHDHALDQYGYGIHGFLDEHTVRSAAAQAQASIRGKYFHGFPAGMAAAYLYFLANQQGFLNGNKRAAVGSTIEFLARNGFQMTVGNYELYEFTVRVAGEDVKTSTRRALAEITKWIEARLAPVDERES